MSPFVQKRSPVDQRKQEIEKELAVLRSRRRVLTRQLRKSGEDLPASVFAEADWRTAPVPVSRHTAVDLHASEAPPSRAEAPGVEKRTGARGKPSAATAVAEAKPRGNKVRDARFADYLSGSMETGRNFRHERSMQRNRAILMLLFMLLVLGAVLTMVLL